MATDAAYVLGGRDVGHRASSDVAMQPIDVRPNRNEWRHEKCCMLDLLKRQMLQASPEFEGKITLHLPSQLNGVARQKVAECNLQPLSARYV